MKKTILIIAILFLSFTTAKAQKKITIGVKGGINLANMTSVAEVSHFSEEKGKTGFNIGIISEIAISKKMSIQPEILYSTQGGNPQLFWDGFYPGNVGSGPKTEFILDYIQAPILAKIYIYKNLSIELGPSFNFLTKDKEIISTNIATRTVSDIGKSFEFSGVIGTSYKLENGLFGSARYVQGMTDTIDEGVRNNNFQIGIGYFF